VGGRDNERGSPSPLSYHTPSLFSTRSPAPSIALFPPGTLIIYRPAGSGRPPDQFQTQFIEVSDQQASQSGVVEWLYQSCPF